MLAFGIISEVDAPKGLARVRFPDLDDMVSNFLPISVAKTKDDKFSIPLDINEHVWCLMDEKLEYGIIGGAIYDANNQPDGGDNDKVAVKFAGSLRVEFDRNSKTLTIDGTGDLTVDINGTGKGKVNIKCNQAVIESLTDVEIKAVTEIKLTAPIVTVSGTLNAAAIATVGGGSITGSGNMNITGNIVAAQIQEGTGPSAIRLGTHKHIGVTTGGGTSGTPVP